MKNVYKPRLISTRDGSVERVMHEQPCQVLEKCGSCPILDVPYRNQLIQKSVDLKNILSEEGNFFSEVIFKDCVESEERFGYRHTVKLVVSEQGHSFKRWINLGFYRQSLNEVIDIGRCPIQTNFINEIMAYLRGAIKTFKVSVYTPSHKLGLLHSLIIRTSKATGQTFVIFSVTKPDAVNLRPLARALTERFTSVQGVFMQNAPFLNKQKLGDKKSTIEEFVLLAGQNYIEEQYGNVTYKFFAHNQIPVNPKLLYKLYKRIEDLADLTGKETVLTLNSGLGIMPLVLASSCALVIAIDSTLNSRADYLKNAKLNTLKNIEFHEGEAAHVLREIIDTKKLEKVDVVVLNPSQHETDAKAIDLVTQLSPKAIIYFSSFVDNLQNDVKKLFAKGYKPVFVEPYDSLPGTLHYEVLCYFVPVK